MDVMEKLVDLLKEIVAIQECGFGDPRPTYETVASYLMSHGVTVQEWIPVTENPKRNGCYIVVVNHWVDCKPVAREAYWNGCDWLSCEKRQEITPRVTHWMPLPETPKEDA